MKCIKYLLPLSFACISIAHATPKHVTLPFSHEPIFTTRHQGLIFDYDMGKTPAKKIVCELSYVYKGWLEFTKQGEARESAVYGDADGVDVLTLTTKQQVQQNVYQADQTGTIRVNSTYHRKAPNAAASCYYKVE